VDINFPIPGAEDPAQGQNRFCNAMNAILQQSDGDIAVVAHCTVIQSFLSFVLGTDVNQCRQYKLDYTSITTIGYEDGKFSLKSMNVRPRIPLSDELCEKLMTKAKAPLAHCQEVAGKADAITRALADAGLELNSTVTHFGALLHDIAKKEPDHPAAGAQWLRDLGWEAVAEAVRTHHDPENPEINEQNVVYLADKLPVEERFARSIVKCTTHEARNAHARRLFVARQLKLKINALCGKEIVP
jgi:HD superfamily phosphohydrolase YqeK